MTPAQRQYMELKNQHKDCLLLFRMGDFYETFWEDAKITSRELDIVLTYKDKNSSNPTPMAGIPYHSSDKHLPKLVQKWYKVAIAEQTWKVIPWQLVKREVVNILTPGTYLDAENKNYNFLCAVTKSETNQWNYHIAYGDFSLWNYYTKSFQDFEEFLSFLIKINPNEVVIDIDFLEKQQLKEQIKMYLSSIVNIQDIPHNPWEFIKYCLKTENLSWYWKALQPPRDNSFALLLNYLFNTQKQQIKNIWQITYLTDTYKVNLDENTIRNLEIFRSSYEWQKKHSLFAVINHTNSWMWNRKMTDIICNPTNDVTTLKKRLDKIQYFIDNPETNSQLIENIKKLHDIPKIISTLIYKKNSPLLREKLKNSLEIIFLDWEKNHSIINQIIKIDEQQKDTEQIYNFCTKLSQSIKENPTETEYIQKWFDDKIDEFREIANNSSKLILQYQQQIAQHTNIQWIKIKYITNQGYFIETTKKDSKKLESKADPDNPKFDFVRAQTLKNQERYTSSYLQEIQQKISQAREELGKLQRKVLEELLFELENLNKSINQISENIWFLDVYTSFADFASKNNWTRPIIWNNSNIQITQGRHPVIEKFLPTNENFVPNDLNMEYESNYWLKSDDRTTKKNEKNIWTIHIITWPNMWWKSTFLRQNAIIVLLSHCGLYVPAQNAKIKAVDGIYARVGSGDVIAKNQSTFLTEMIEVANILNNSTKDSFIILDELGRWTSTYDWVAIAKAIIQFLSENTKANTLFATHYHELIQLEKQYKNIKNFSVSVYETDKKVVFLKKIVEWWASKSYWIDVAKIAWLPKDIITLAKKNLQELEKKKINFQQTPLFDYCSTTPQTDQQMEKIKEKIKQIQINDITPLQALQILSKLKEEI